MSSVPLQFLPSKFQQRLFGVLVPDDEEPDDDGWYFAYCPTRNKRAVLARLDLDAQINWMHGSIRCLHDEACGGTKRGVRSLTRLMEDSWLAWLSERGYEQQSEVH